MPWDNTTGTTVAESDAAAGYAWAIGNVGTNEEFALPTDAPQPGEFWYGTFGGEQPANAAVDPLATIPGYGQGTGQLAAIEPTTEIPCDPTPRRLTVPCGQQKTHRVEGVVDENGAPIDTGDEELSFVVERANGIDIETGPATMVEPGVFIFDVDLASQTPGEYRWAIRTRDRGAVVVYGNVGDYVVLDIAKEGNPASIPAVELFGVPVCVGAGSCCSRVIKIIRGSSYAAGDFEWTFEGDISLATVSLRLNGVDFIGSATGNAATVPFTSAQTAGLPKTVHDRPEYRLTVILGTNTYVRVGRAEII